MRLREVVVKASLGRLNLHHLRSPYRAEINPATLDAIEAALRGDVCLPSPAADFVDKLARRGLTDDAPFEPIPRRNSSDVVSLEIEPIGRCNLTCVHCFVEFSRRRMTDALFAAVLEGARALGAIELTFNGGEPLLHPRCVDWIGRAARAGLRTVLFTNATLVTDSVAGRLAAADLAKAVVSLDGLEAEHDALRGPGTFERTTAAIRRLARKGIHVVVTSMVTPANQARREELRRLCLEDLGVRAIRWSTIATMGRAADRPDLQLDPASVRGVYGELDRTRRPSPGRPPGLLPCAAGVDKLFIASDGRVYGCHLFEQAGDVLGDLGVAALAEIYECVSPVSNGDRYYRFDPAQLEGCSSCAKLPVCRGGCRARAWRMTKSPIGPDPVSCAKFGLDERSSSKRKRDQHEAPFTEMAAMFPDHGRM